MLLDCFTYHYRLSQILLWKLHSFLLGQNPWGPLATLCKNFFLPSLAPSSAPLAMPAFTLKRSSRVMPGLRGIWWTVGRSFSEATAWKSPVCGRTMQNDRMSRVFPTKMAEVWNHPDFTQFLEAEVHRLARAPNDSRSSRLPTVPLLAWRDRLHSPPPAVDL